MTSGWLSLAATLVQGVALIFLAIAVRNLTVMVARQNDDARWHLNHPDYILHRRVMLAAQRWVECDDQLRAAAPDTLEGLTGRTQEAERQLRQCVRDWEVHMRIPVPESEASDGASED